MPIDAKASSNWDRAANAYCHYVAYIAAKAHRLELSFTDLIYVKNFKGGSAVIGEPATSLPFKLTRLSQALVAADASGDLSVPLADLSGASLQRAKARMLSFMKEAVCPETRINGFGVSFASAMLHFYFPTTVPILDRRVLNGARIQGIQVNTQGQVNNLVSLYPSLVDYFAVRLRNNRSLSLRQLDRELFIEKLSDQVFRSDC